MLLAFQIVKNLVYFLNDCSSNCQDNPTIGTKSLVIETSYSEKFLGKFGSVEGFGGNYGTI